MNRREAMITLLGGPAVLLTASKVHSVNLQSVRGCRLGRAHFKQLQGPGVNFFQLGELVTTTGDHVLDKYLGQALVRLSVLFSERPGFGFIDDSGAPNAYATDQTLVRGTWGTVCFGENLFYHLMNRYDDRGFAIMAVAAHEFGHIAQFRSGIDRRLLQNQHTVKRLELHADFLSGYFLGVRKRQQPSISVWAAGDDLYRSGDYEFHDVEHHGTPEQRVAVAEKGYILGYDGSAGFKEAFSLGVQYILSNY